MISLSDIEHPSGLGRDHNPPKIVDLPSDSRLHRGVTLPIGLVW